jgi:hypothetical protein
MGRGVVGVRPERRVVWCERAVVRRKERSGVDRVVVSDRGRM